MQKETLWDIKVVSSVPNTYGLTEDCIKEMLNAYNHPANKEFQDEHYEKGRNDKDEHIREWYNITGIKDVEIHESFIKNIKLVYTKDKIEVSSHFTISFPTKDWKARDVREWAPGTIYLHQQWLLAVTDNMSIKDVPNYQEKKSLMTDLIRKEKATIKKVKDVN